MPLTKSVVLRAEDTPLAGVATPRPNQRYRSPRLSVEARPVPAPGIGEVLVEPIYVGICGTDLHMVTPNAQTGYVQSSAPAVIPATGRVIGHEGVARIKALGEGVWHVRPGQIVGLESIIACGECDVCRRGAPNQCRSAKLLGLETDGLFSEQAVVPARLCRPIGQLAESDEGLRAASLLEPTAVAYLAGLNSRINPGERVLIFGGGPIGLLMAILSHRMFGARQVHLVEPVLFRRNLASAAADEVFSVDAFLGSSGSYDVLIDASGALESVAMSIPRLDASGRLCLLARTGAPFHIHAVDHLLTNNIAIIGSRGHLGGHFDRLTAAIEDGRLDLNVVITETVEGLDALSATLGDPGHVSENNCKILCRLPGAVA